MSLTEESLAQNNNIDRYTSFEDMNLKTPLLRGIYTLGYETPSMIQQKGIVPALKGNDVILHSQSGTGKTATFSIAVLNGISFEEFDPHMVQALILSPTRDLAQQTQQVVKNLGRYMNINCHCCIGGKSTRDDFDVLKTSPHIVTGTPGRIIANMKNKSLLTRNIKTVVIDECDVMLTEGFKEDMYFIFTMLPKETQVIIVSATFPPQVLEMSKKFMNNPTEILIPQEEITLEGIKQFYVSCPNDFSKEDVIKDLFEMITLAQTVIFTNSKNRAISLCDSMNRDDHAATCIHSDMPQREREDILRGFIKGESRVLIATDIIARGIDVQQISLVMNFDLPTSKENYIHRIGRGGRFGRKSVAINLVTDRDRYKLTELEQYYSTIIDEMPSDVANYF